MYEQSDDDKRGRRDGHIVEFGLYHQQKQGESHGSRKQVKATTANPVGALAGLGQAQDRRGYHIDNRQDVQQNPHMGSHVERRFCQVAQDIYDGHDTYHKAWQQYGDELVAKVIGACGCNKEYGQEPGTTHADAGDDLEAVNNLDDGNVSGGNELSCRIQDAESDGQVHQVSENMNFPEAGGPLRDAITHHQENGYAYEIDFDYKGIDFHRFTL